MTNQLVKDSENFKAHIVFCDEREKKRDEQHLDNKSSFKAIFRILMVVAGSTIMCLLTALGYVALHVFEKVAQ